MSHWKKSLVRPDDSLKQVISVLDGTDSQICLVVDEEQRLLGTITDGDIRRAILRSQPFDIQICEVMNVDPVTCRSDQSDETLRNIMLNDKVRQLPCIDSDRHVIGLILLDELVQKGKVPSRKNWVVLMAGGLGSRLQPLTNTTPKPLLHVGDQPILERILESLIEYNFENFYISVNYKAEMVKDHFGDGSKWNVNIRYLEEDAPLGTAGALTLLPSIPDQPILVMNGDVLSEINFSSLMDFHQEQRADATMCVRHYDFQVPYGVVTTKNLKITAIEEKPSHKFFVNAGIYVLEPKTLNLLPEAAIFDMTDLFLALIEANNETTVFPIREYWLDIGRMNDFQLAQKAFDANTAPETD